MAKVLPRDPRAAAISPLILSPSKHLGPGGDGGGRRRGEGEGGGGHLRTAREQRIGGVACCYYCTEEVGGWCSSLAFVGSRGVGDGLGLSVTNFVTNS